MPAGVLTDETLYLHPTSELIVHIARAFCIQAGRVVDIYQARALFFNQEEPRSRLEFLCSDDACRAQNATKVTGVNYDKLVEEECDGIVVKPHFRMNPKCSHIVACEWLAREIALEVGKTDGPPWNARHSVSRFRRVKSGDIVDVFLPRFPVSLVAAGPRREAEKVDSYEPHTDRGPRQGRSDNVTTADFLETVVSAYELLELEERREARLRIAFGPRLPYSKAFCQIQHYFATRGRRIYHGGVCVRLHGPNFSVRFFDRIVARKDTDGNESCDVSLYLKRDGLLKHWNGKFVIAQLTEAAQPTNYAHCYFYGQLIPHPKFLNRLTIEFETLEQIVFVVRRKRSHVSNT